MDENKIEEKLEESLDSQDLNYSLEVDVDDDDITVAVSYEGDDFPKLGSEIDEILDGDIYRVKFGELKPEDSLPDMRSRTFTLTPINYD